MVVERQGQSCVKIRNCCEKSDWSFVLVEEMTVIQEAHVMQAGENLSVGSRVRVAQSVIVYHHPEHRNHPFDMKGQEGEVVGIVREWQGRPVSANLPYLVKFDGKFRAHFQASELELISEN